MKKQNKTTNILTSLTSNSHSCKHSKQRALTLHRHTALTSKRIVTGTYDEQVGRGIPVKCETSWAISWAIAALQIHSLM